MEGFNMFTKTDGVAKLEHELKEGILNGTIEPEARLMTVREMAKRFSVTYGQAQRVVKRLEKQGLLVTRRGGGTRVATRLPPDPSTVKEQGHRVVLVSADSAFWTTLNRNPAGVDFLHGLESVLSREGHSFQMVKRRELELALGETQRNLAPVICFQSTVGEDAERLEGEHAKGRVILLPFEGSSASTWGLTVDADGISGIQMALDHLASLGHCRILMASFEWPGKEDWLGWAREREDAYSRFMARLGETPKIVKVPHPPSDAVETIDATRIVDELKKGDAGWTAILAVNDHLAEYLIMAAADAGLVVPRDISVIGFDNLPFALSWGLTTVDRVNKEIGELCGEIALRAIRVPGFRARGRILVSPKLVIRRTTMSPQPR